MLENVMSDNLNNHTTNPMAAKPNVTVAYTDGACKGNPGAGGWGAHLIFSDGSTQDLYGGEPDTTNNRMELMGAISALKYSPQNIKIELWTDSSYVKNGINEWIANWKKRGWKTTSKKSVANQDLWQQLDALNNARDVDWHWVKGHAGHAGNEKADELANLGVTSSSERDTNNAINNAIKKKPSIAVDAEKDWLSFDPLGLDDFEDEEAQQLEDTVLLNGFVTTEKSLTVTENHKSYNTKPIAERSTTKPMSTDTMIANNTTSDTVDLEPVILDSMNLDSVILDSLSVDNNPQTDLPKFDGDTSRANPHFRPLLPKPIHRGENDRQLIMDTETTGLDALKGDRIIEVGIVEMVARKFTGEKLHVYINPQRGMDEEVIKIHGISEAFLTDKPTFDQVAQSLYEFMDGAEIIAHNASFDMNFLTMEFDKVGMSDFAQRVRVTDSLLMAKQQYPGQKNTLDALVRRLDVGKQDRSFHGALLDSEILAEVYLAMTGGQVTLAIEENAQSDGGATTHANFATLAALLLESSGDHAANQAWFANLATEYPEINTKMSQW